MVLAGSLEPEEQCHTGLLTACEQEHLLLLTQLSEKLYDIVSSLPSYRPATSWVHYTTSCNTQSNALKMAK
jgi:hypothetical protein